jgi:hypothetical protein
LIGLTPIVEGGGYFVFMVFCILCVVLVGFGSIRSGVKVASLRITFVIGALMLCATGWVYYQRVTARAMVQEADCDNTPSPDGNYSAQVCYKMGRVILRVSDPRKHVLLAERTFSNIDVPVRLYWESDRLQFENGDPMELGQIALPPSLKDRILARLP